MGSNRYYPDFAAPGQAPGPQHVHGAPQPRLHATRHPAPHPQAAGYGHDPYAPHAQHPAYTPYSPEPEFDPYAGYALQGGGHPQTYAQPHAAPPQPRPSATPRVAVGHVAHAVGAVLSVALIIGAGAWMWQMIQRDVAGVPVVRALEGPVRVAPDDPGGRQAAHQGLAVNGLAGASEEAPRDQITLAPPPLSLSDADMAAPSPHADTRELTAGDEMQPIPAALPRETDAEAPAPGRDAPALGIKDPTQRAVAQSPRPTPRDGEAASQARASAPAASQSSSSSSSDSDDLVASVAESVEASISGNRSFDVDPATIGPGTRLVQLGAYDDVEKARTAWDQLARRFSPLLDDRGRVIEAAHSGGSVFYRLRAHGFSDERDARRFCAALVDQQIDCIPVLIR